MVEQVTFNLKPEPGHEVCDFCSDPDIRWSYIAHSFKMGSLQTEALADVEVIHVNSVTNWAACDPCHQLIQANHWDELLARSTARYPGWWALPASVQTAIQGWLRQTWALFRSASFGVQPYVKGSV